MTFSFSGKQLRQSQGQEGQVIKLSLPLFTRLERVRSREGLSAGAWSQPQGIVPTSQPQGDSFQNKSCTQRPWLSLHLTCVWSTESLRLSGEGLRRLLMAWVGQSNNQWRVVMPGDLLQFPAHGGTTLDQRGLLV